MSSRCQVLKSSRDTCPNCHPEYTVYGSLAGICTHIPSPPFTGYQSPSVMPNVSRVRLGPHHTPLSWRDRKSTRLNSSHLVISYAVFCLKKKKKRIENTHAEQ